MSATSSSPAIVSTEGLPAVRFDPRTCTLHYPAEDGQVKGIRLQDDGDSPLVQAALLLAKIQSGGLDVGRMHPYYAMTAATRAAAERLLERLVAGALH
jgi:hypothetical protein